MILPTSSQSITSFWKRRHISTVCLAGVVFNALQLRAEAFSFPSPRSTDLPADDRIKSRSTFLTEAASSLSLLGLGLNNRCASLLVPPANAEVDGIQGSKLTNISDDELKRLITADMVDRSFLVTADLTRELYDENAMFTDEIDTYTLPQWVKGTKKLFVGEGSRVDLVGDVNVSPEQVDFRFDEDLMFRIPLRPVVSLTGKVVLKRNPKSGLITSYQEFWDQDVVSVLKTAKFK